MNSISDQQKNSPVLPYAWVILLVVYLASIVAPFNMAKVPPILPVLQAHFHLTIGQSGWLISVFALVGIFLSLPAGTLLNKYGTKAIGLIALGCLAIGSSIGALSGTMLVLMISRVVEGAGMGLISVMAPAAIAEWFPPERRGTPMGIWATWFPFGSVVISNLAPALEAWNGWRMVWWVTAGFALVVLIIFGAFMKNVPKKNVGQAGNDPGAIREAISNKTIWTMAFVFSCYTFALISVTSFLPTFLAVQHGYSLQKAAFISSLSSFVIMGSAPLAGWVSDRIGSRRWVFSIPFLTIVLVLILIFRIEGWYLVGLLVFLGIFAPAVPTTIISAASELVRKPEVIGFNLAIVMIGQNFGMFFGPVVFGKLIELQGWVTASYWLIPVCLVGFFVASRVKVK